MKPGFLHCASLLVLMTCLLLPSESAWASMAPKHQQSVKAEKPRKADKIQSEQQAVRAAKSKYPGKLLKVNASGKGYRVKLLSSNGTVFSVYVDARTGQVRKN